MSGPAPTATRPRRHLNPSTSEMNRLVKWVRAQHRRYGPIVGMVAALTVLLLLTLLLAAIMGLVALLMWLDPYAALVAAVLATAYLIYKRY